MTSPLISTNTTRKTCQFIRSGLQRALCAIKGRWQGDIIVENNKLIQDYSNRRIQKKWANVDLHCRWVLPLFDRKIRIEQIIQPAGEKSGERNKKRPFADFQHEFFKKKNGNAWFVSRPGGPHRLRNNLL